MGGFTQWRNFLYNLFPECFSSDLTSDVKKSFHLCIIDLMQFLNPLIHTRVNTNSGIFLNTDDIIHQLLTTVKFYMNSEDHPNAPSFSRGTVLLFDSILNVPKNKVSTQQSRDEQQLKRKAQDNQGHLMRQKQVKTNDHDDNVRGGGDDDEEEECIIKGDENDDDDPNCILDEIRFYELIKKLNIIDSSYHLLIKYDMNQSIQGLIQGIDGSTLWRSINLKWQIYRMLTHELLHLNIKKGSVLVIDEGIAIAETTYEKVRQQMINDHYYNEKSLYEKEVLVSNLILKHIVEKFILFDDHKFTRIMNKPEFVGEADVKLLQYLTPHNGLSKYLVVSQDTDIIFILLLHLKRFINPNTKRWYDDSFELYLDTQTPADKNSSKSHPYRFINVKKLFIRLNEFFRQEYYTVENPIELFVFLVSSLKTDFTSTYNSYLTITPRLIWNTFSELHYTITAKKPDSSSASSSTTKPSVKDQGYVLFNGISIVKNESELGVPKRCNKANYTSSLRHVLNDAVKYQFNSTNQTYHFILNIPQIQKFFYQLCQIKLVKDMASLGYHQFQTSSSNLTTNMKPYIALPSDIFIYANEMIQKVELYKQQQSSSPHSAYDNSQTKPSLSKSFKPSLGIGGSNTKSGNMNTSTLSKKQQDALKKLSEKEIPKQCGIPSEKAMKARLYRVHWIMEYYQNGGLTSKYGKNHSDINSMDHQLSIWGWKCEYIKNPNTRDFNSSYYLSKSRETNTNYDMPFNLFLIKETDDVFDRDNRVSQTNIH